MKNNSKIGIVLNHLGPTQLAFSTITDVNKSLRTGLDISPIIFYENIFTQCAVANFPLMHVSELYNFSGIAVATDIHSANKVTNTFSCKKKIFYVWDLEWHRPPTKNFYDMYKTYNSMPIITRTTEHAKLIQQNFNVTPIGVMENFSCEQLLKCLQTS